MLFSAKEQKWRGILHIILHLLQIVSTAQQIEMVSSYLLTTKAISLWVVPHFTYMSSVHSTADSNETKSNAVNIWTKNDSKHFNGAKISNVTDTEIKRRPGYVGDVWKVLFPRFGLPSTQIRHENAAFQKRSLNRRYWNGKHFENEAFRKRWRREITWFPWPNFLQIQNDRWLVRL